MLQFQFLLQRFIQTDIRGYSPAPGDLAYPDKLIVAAQAISDQDPSSDSVFDTSGTEVCLCINQSIAQETILPEGVH